MEANTLLSILVAQGTWHISRTALALLIVIAERPMRPREIAPLLCISDARLNSTSRTLVSRRIIRKVRLNDGDERAVEYTITPYGKGILQHILEGTAQPETPDSTPAPTPP